MKIKNSIEYFWNFYKWQLLCVFILLILGISFLVTALFQKECALSVMLLDCYTEVSSESMEKDILQVLQLDERKFAVEMQNNFMLENTEAGGYTMTSISRFLADIGSEKLDVCGMLENSFQEYDESGAFLDLRLCFDEVQLLCLQDALVIADDGRVIGLYANCLPGLQRDGCYDSPDDKGIIGIIYNTGNLENAKTYLMYLAGMTE